MIRSRMSRSAAAPSSGTPSASATASGTCSAVATEARRTPKAPSGNALAARAAAAIASAVLPGAARADQRHQPRIGEQLAQRSRAGRRGR